MRAADPAVNESPEASRCLEVAANGQGWPRSRSGDSDARGSPRDIESRSLMPATDGDHHPSDGDHPIVVTSPSSRFLEKTLNSRALDSVSPLAGMLPLQMPDHGKGRQSR